MLQKNRYLEELGLKTEFYGTNCLGAENNVSQCKLERKNYGFIFLELIDFNQSLLELALTSKFSFSYERRIVLFFLIKYCQSL